MNLLQDFEQNDILASYTSFLRQITHIPTGIQHVLRVQNYKKSQSGYKSLQNMINAIQNSHSEYLLIPKQWVLSEKQDVFTQQNILNLTSIQTKAQINLHEYTQNNFQNCHIPKFQEITNIFLPIAKGDAFIKLKPQNIMRLDDNSWVIDPTSIHLQSQAQFNSSELIFYPPQLITQGLIQFKKEQYYVYQLSMSILAFMTSNCIYQTQNPTSLNGLDSLLTKVSSDILAEFIDLIKLNIQQWPFNCCKIDDIIQILEENKFVGKVDQDKFMPSKIKIHIKSIVEFLAHGNDITASIQKLRDVTDEIYFVSDSTEKENLTIEIINIIISTILSCRDEQQAEDLINMIYKLYPEPQIIHADAHFIYGNLLCSLMDYIQSIEQYNKAVEILLNNSAENTLRTGDIYYNIGISKMCLKEHVESLKYFQKALQIRTFLFGNSAEIVGDTYHNIGFVNGELKRYVSSLNYYLKTKNIRIKLNGQQNEKTADAIYNIGWTYLQIDQVDLAQNYLEQALKIRKQLQGIDPTKIADSYHNIGLVLIKKQELDIALEYLQQSIQIQEDKGLGPSERLALGYYTLGECYYSTRRYNEARNSFTSAIEIKQALGYSNFEDIEQLIEDCYQQIQKEYIF